MYLRGEKMIFRKDKRVLRRTEGRYDGDRVWMWC